VTADNSDTETSQTDGETLISGLRELVDTSVPDDEYHCPNCHEHFTFDVLGIVKRPEFGVAAPVKACPNCKYTHIPQTEWSEYDDE
jgi:RNA polymerase subunit RPABC4/transcription elongation factor Spt4